MFISGKPPASVLKTGTLAAMASECRPAKLSYSGSKNKSETSKILLSVPACQQTLHHHEGQALSRVLRLQGGRGRRRSSVVLPAGLSLFRQNSYYILHPFYGSEVRSVNEYFFSIQGNHFPEGIYGFLLKRFTSTKL